MKDQHGNNLKLVPEEELYPETSRLNPGYSYYDLRSKVTLIEYGYAKEDWDWHPKPRWRVLRTVASVNVAVETTETEKDILNSIGIWITNNITGETFEYTDENPCMVGRPINLQDALISENGKERIKITINGNTSS